VVLKYTLSKFFFTLFNSIPMPIIKLETFIHSNLDICFDLARSIDLHSISTAKTNEKAIAGRTIGLIGLNETVTWEATHLGVRQNLTSKITAFERPFHFRDEQQKGIFKFIQHDHFFEEKENGVLMRDVFHYQAPLQPLGRIVEKLFLTNYLKKFLVERNAVIKEYAETELYKTLL
jgi:ligand-binding SRPBCC domain-containing protein